jgi:hypothetical protein
MRNDQSEASSTEWRTLFDEPEDGTTNSRIRMPLALEETSSTDEKERSPRVIRS